MNHSQIDLDSLYFAEPNPLHTSYKTYIRFETDEGQIVDLYSNDGKAFKATLTNYIRNYIATKNKKDDPNFFQYVYKKINFDSAISTKVAIQLLRSGLDTVPTDSLIKSWENGWLDCFSGVAFFIKLNGRLIRKTYSCLGERDSTVRYATIIKSDVANIVKQFNLDTNYCRFEYQLPKEGKCYSRNGFMVTYYSTAKESKAWMKNKPYRDYFNSIKDSLRSYLSDTLTKLFARYSDIHCYGQFFLTFSPKNELLKVITNATMRDADDRKKYGDCKKKIFEAFKYIHVNFVKCLKPYTITLEFDNENKPRIIE